MYGCSLKVMGVHVERKGTAALKIPKSVNCTYSANGTKHALWGTEVPRHKTAYDTEKQKGTNIKGQNLNRKACCGAMKENFNAVTRNLEFVLGKFKNGLPVT
jgi:hypothetical protein